MADDHDEVESTYDVDPTMDLAAVLAAMAHTDDGIVVREVHDAPDRLEATYFDTPDHRLARARLTLRRRTGGGDEGWHLKIPTADGARAEVHLAACRAVHTVPAALRRMVRARSAGARLVPVVRITTDRQVRHLVDHHGVVLAEIADDRVVGQRLPRDPQQQIPALEWREVEVELVEGDRALLAKIDARVRALGVQPSASGSKLLRVLGPDLTQQAPHTTGSPESPAGQVVLAYVAAQVEQLLFYDPMVRLERPDSVHKMRVASRRLRSATKTFATLFDTDAIRPVRAELKWLAGQLGVARDAEVLRDRLNRASSDGGHDDAVGKDADARLGQAYRAAHDQLLADLDSERYHELVQALRALMDHPPVTAQAEEPAHPLLPARVRADYRALAKRVSAGLDATPGAERDRLLHEARKRAKRSRYAAESLSAAFGDDATAFAAGMEQVQEVLGEHQDGVVMRARLSDLAASTTSTALAFGYGRLHAMEETRSEKGLRQLAEVWQRASKRKRRRWLS